MTDDLCNVLLSGCRTVTVMELLNHDYCTPITDYGHDIQPLLDLGYIELVTAECNGIYYVTPAGVLALLQHFINEYERYMNEAP